MRPEGHVIARNIAAMQYAVYLWIMSMSPHKTTMPTTSEIAVIPMHKGRTGIADMAAQSKIGIICRKELICGASFSRK